MTIGDFTEQAAAYERARPGYPEGLIDTLIEEAGIKAGDPVVEFGAGTGIFTRMLVDRGLHVTAVEPNEDMMRRAPPSDAGWVKGTFADNPLAHESYSWGVAAQAFHWANPPACLPQISRVLKQNGVFTVLWNNRANRECEVLAWTEKLIRRRVPEFDEAYRDRPWEEVLASTGDFCFLGHHVVRHTVAMSTSRYLDLWQSHNRLNNIAGPERFAIFFNELRSHLDRYGSESIDVPYDCEAWSARRTDSHP